MGTQQPSTATVDVLIVDDQPPFRAVARTLVSLLAGWRVVAEVETGEDAVAAAAEVAPRITAERPETRVVLLSTYAADDLPADAGDCGAAAYVRKEDLTPRRLREVLSG
jgi:DNA-binding NarL/FixJ family response regulator